VGSCGGFGLIEKVGVRGGAAFALFKCTLGDVRAIKWTGGTRVKGKGEKGHDIRIEEGFCCGAVARLSCTVIEKDAPSWQVLQFYRSFDPRPEGRAEPLAVQPLLINTLLSQLRIFHRLVH